MSLFRTVRIGGVTVRPDAVPGSVWITSTDEKGDELLDERDVAELIEVLEEAIQR